MALIQNILKKFGYVSMKEAEGLGTGDDDEDSYLYRPLSGYDRRTGGFNNGNIRRDAKVRELSSYILGRQSEIAYALWVRNPLARHIIRLFQIFTVGPYWETENETVKAVLTKHDNDPDNNWNGEKNQQRAMELSMFGEQCYPIGINPINGHMKLGYLDATNISSIKVSDFDNMLVEKIYYRTAGALGDERFFYPVRFDEDGSYGQLIAKDAESRGSKPGMFYQGRDTKGKYVGEAFYFAINKVIASTRGTSDLLSVADWIDSYGEMLFTHLDRAHLINNFVYDVTIDGASESQIKLFLKDLPAPTPGTVRAHNDRVHWQALTPQFGAADMKGVSDLIKGMILIGGGFPSHWFGDGQTTNRATAQEMGLPTLEMLKERRNYFAEMKRMIYQTQVDSYVLAAGEIKDLEEDEPPFTMFIPPMSEKQWDLYAASFASIVTSLAVCEGQGWIKKESAAKVAKSIIEQVGTEVELPEDIEGPEEDKKEEKEKPAKPENGDNE